MKKMDELSRNFINIYQKIEILKKNFYRITGDTRIPGYQDTRILGYQDTRISGY